MSAANVFLLPLTSSLLLDAFDSPVTFHRCLVPITGSVTAALMLSQAIWASQAPGREPNAWITISADQWREQTGLSRREEETARRALRAGGFIEERRIGMPPQLSFRVRPERILRALQCHAKTARTSEARV